jgi:hypothetical protein
MQTSPGGSIFPYYFKDGELFGLHFGSYFSNEEGIIAMMKAEEVFFLRQNRAIPIWMDFYQTDLTDRVLAQWMVFIQDTRERITRLALVGCSPKSRTKINSRIKKSGVLTGIPLKYFKDPEDAKTWLVSENGEVQRQESMKWTRGQY